jgi:hypothetical protein
MGPELGEYARGCVGEHDDVTGGDVTSKSR